MRPVGPRHRRNGREIGSHVENVGVRHQGQGGEREGREVVLAARRYAVPQRAQEVVIAPGADPGRRVGGDVAAVIIAERRWYVEPAGERRRSRRIARVAGGAIRGNREILAATHGGRIGRRRETTGGGAWVPSQPVAAISDVATIA